MGYSYAIKKQLQCECCGEYFYGYENKFTKKNRYCSLECDFKSKGRKMYSYEFVKLILEFSIEHKDKTLMDITRIFGVDKSFVKRLVKKYGNRELIPIKEFNEDFFELINTEEKAYWLGFIYADGYVSIANNRTGILGIGLAEIDYEHLVKFSNSIDLNKKFIVHKNVTLGDKIHRATQVSVPSYKIVTDLENKGCHQAKSLTLKFPNINQVPSDLIRHFLRGYFDGDGSVSYGGHNKSKISYIGTENFLEGVIFCLEKELGDLGIITIHTSNIGISTHDKTKYFNKTGINSVRIMKYLYENSTIYLDRKYKKYLQCFALYKDVLSSSTEK